MRLFYAAGPGDVIAAHRHWRRGEDDPTEVSITFSSQVEDFCRARGAAAWIVSYHPRRERLDDGEFTIEHLPRRENAGALAYHADQLVYALRLLARAVRFRADVALIDSGTAHPFLLALFALFGMRVIPVLHNTLWPHGFPPVRAVPRFLLRLDALFWRTVPLATLCVSPECARQVETLTRGRSRRLVQIRAQFRPAYFASIPPPPPHAERPFRVLFIGRVHRDKGVFDLLDMAAELEAGRPGAVHFEICGRGPALEELVDRRKQRGLEGAVTLHGWTSLEALSAIYARCHAAIVPTRSGFIEGLAMTAAEAILAGRPLVTNPVVPALELLRPACVTGVTDDAPSHAAAIRSLADDAALWERLRAACPAAGAPFVDRSQGLTAVLERIVPRD